MTSSPVLIFLDYSKEFILCTDASDILISGILMKERNRKPQSIAYASRFCMAAEKNYSITERQTLAVLYCLEHWRGVIVGYAISLDRSHSYTE